MKSSLGYRRELNRYVSGMEVSMVGNCRLEVGLCRRCVSVDCAVVEKSAKKVRVVPRGERVCRCMK